MYGRQPAASGLRRPQREGICRQAALRTYTRSRKVPLFETHTHTQTLGPTNSHLGRSSRWEPNAPAKEHLAFLGFYVSVRTVPIETTFDRSAEGPSMSTDYVG
ncbi:hypothetical protein KGM_206500 [Danaus plexippus plexippus]|uniref:Uncharacterized protein n=1 Tax=Danaus plexippus plexippus TaxID=278856 RepID=A0A212F173_DANPL|nr:hypothetical protein KGM_206500 [Danaus plexippus plexippus]